MGRQPGDPGRAIFRRAVARGGRGDPRGAERLTAADTARSASSWRRTRPSARGSVPSARPAGSATAWRSCRACSGNAPGAGCPQARPAFPELFTVTAGRRHPCGRRRPSGIVYARAIPWLGRTLTFRTLTEPGDIALFSGWMNDPRVAAIWEESGSLAAHAALIARLQDDPATLPLFGCLDGQPFGYFELYWARESRLGPLYESGPYDRGWHVAIGDPAVRGRPYLSAWLPSLMHYLFLDEPRTARIVGEPRADHAQQIRNLHASGFGTVATIDFPHKRAALVACRASISSRPAVGAGGGRRRRGAAPARRPGRGPLRGSVRMTDQPTTDDILGIGFGPANLSLAIALRDALAARPCGPPSASSSGRPLRLAPGDDAARRGHADQLREGPRVPARSDEPLQLPQLPACEGPAQHLPEPQDVHALADRIQRLPHWAAEHFAEGRLLWRGGRGGAAGDPGRTPRGLRRGGAGRGRRAPAQAMPPSRRGGGGRSVDPRALRGPCRDRG